MLTKKEKVLEILKDYNGDNPYILRIKSDVFTWHYEKALDDFRIDFVLKNHNVPIKVINRTITLATWFGEKKKEDWNLDFIPEKIRIYSYLGETDKYYCCIAKYRKSVPPDIHFLPKNALLDNMFVSDYMDMNIDFDRYDRLSTSINPNRKLREHQKTGAKFLLNRKKCILADEQGLGKSSTLLVAAIEGNFDSVLIICPASLKTNWKNELMWYVPERDITIVDGFLDKKKDELEVFLGYGKGKSGKKKDELLEEAKDKGKWVDNRFVIVNFDILDEFYKVTYSKSPKTLEKNLQSLPMMKYLFNRKSLIIVDEAHKLSNNTSNRYKLINNLIKMTKPDSIYLSTGTPVTNMPQNLYCLLKLLECPITSDWDFFMTHYCGAEKIYMKGEWKRLCTKFLSNVHKNDYSELTKEEKKECNEFIEKYAKKINVMKDPANLDELKRGISYLYLRRLKSDVTDLPVKTVHEIKYDLTLEQRDKYEQLWDEYEQAKLQEDPDKELNKDLLEGSVYRMYLAEQMTEYTKRFVDKTIANGEKIVIACCFDNELYSLKDYYGDKCVIYNGKCSLKQKDAAIDKFKNDDNVKVIIGNILALGVGITLTNAKKIIFNSFSYVYADNSQMEDRIHRIGQTQACDIYYQMFNDTHCEHMWDIVLRKQYVSDTLITTN